ncbi:NAD(P)H-hydrate dehydratase [Nesterenkonia sp. NBAIMH1]|uniref:NAD(P)H-hydrate dehydratase n=1 Tax=Nesterenkonia sp. NBAIMH1 TaxID=2600320 RepID=UPI0011B7ED31|nr:NAD(P)H-hydrate dehydratase [Nesterenkonia sp. NBAIMH1]
MPSIRGPRTEDHKYSRGTVHLVAGSEQYPGAAVLCAGASVSTGVGMVTLQTPRRSADLVLVAYPEVVAVEAQAARDRMNSAQAAVIGPGLDQSRTGEAAQALSAGARAGTRCVVDATGLDLIPEQVPAAELGEHIVLTPHAGEAARLAQRLGSEKAQARLKGKEPAAAAAALAEAAGCVVVLKGPQTAVARPDGTVRTHRAHAPGLASAGTGDVLAGILGALLATQPEQPHVVAMLAVRLHGAAAQRLDPRRRGRFGASHLVDAIRHAA